MDIYIPVSSASAALLTLHNYPLVTGPCSFISQYKNDLKQNGAWENVTLLLLFLSNVVPASECIRPFQCCWLRLHHLHNFRLSRARIDLPQLYWVYLYSTTLYKISMRFTSSLPWLWDLFVPVPTQLPGEHTSLLPSWH